MPRQPKFMFEANPRQQPSELKRIPVTAIGKRNLSLARILHIRQQNLSGVGNCHWHAKKILGTSLCAAGRQSFQTWQMESLESWQLRQSIGLRQRSQAVRQLQAVWIKSRQKRTRYSLSFHYKNSGSKVHTMSYSVLTALFGVI